MFRHLLLQNSDYIYIYIYKHVKLFTAANELYQTQPSLFLRK